MEGRGRGGGGETLTTSPFLIIMISFRFFPVQTIVFFCYSFLRLCFSILFCYWCCSWNKLYSRTFKVGNLHLPSGLILWWRIGNWEVHLLFTIGSFAVSSVLVVVKRRKIVNHAPSISGWAANKFKISMLPFWRCYCFETGKKSNKLRSSLESK